MRILILGCSFSSGSYTMNSDRYCGEDLDESICWYDYIEGNHEIDVYSHPAGGYLNYSTQISEIAQRKERSLGSYDLVIIQETFEPRFTLYSEQTYREPVKRNNITYYVNHGENRLYVRSKNNATGFVTTIQDNGLKNDNNTLSYLNRLGNNAHLQTIIRGSVLDINFLCQEARVPAVYFRFSEWKNHCHTWVKPLNLPVISTALFFNDIYHNSQDDFIGHLTVAGNQKLGVMVNEAIKSYNNEP